MADYSRSKELKKFDDTKAGVKGLVDSGIVNVPKMFIRPADELAQELIINPTHTNNNNNNQIPTVDLSGTEAGGSRRKETVDQIKAASKEWGIFQVTNHGIPLNAMDEMIDGVRLFNEQDLGLKREIYSHDTTKTVRFNSYADLYTSKIADWRDTLFLSSFRSDLDPNEIPAVCRNSTMEYVKHIKRLGETLFELLSEALGLRSDHLGSMGGSKGCSIVCHYYPPCPQPELTLGLKEHTDPGFLNVLLQNEIDGLQVLHQCQWLDVHPTRGGLIVNIGDLLQIVSNGKLKSVRHRAVNKNAGPRITVSSSFSGHVSLLHKTFSPISELTSEPDPPRYKDFVLKEYYARYLSKSDGKSLTECYKL
ncbi:1-aminocyclopropane-1-carboxylate oxidase-like protein 1-like isoform X3 [Hibiscus syriacus]|uniref:1-aminocyclopropane-1-carboxylate oxidase-like protein 1-like isoform X3 n=1 Tax=Hibiscus syriacus TaxID=106335 RepID=A0A6A2ZY10_HIBSY|nr:1-aminocyclopropane-1-carboxylate oxidase homolog 1-like [Hibiscus syriacus]KAE8696297.1 1-aminocyclopropane-1-carboxylate oxidase-like protein 1-like isoform X3 [Hibiscus syriacus]